MNVLSTKGRPPLRPRSLVVFGAIVCSALALSFAPAWAEEEESDLDSVLGDSPAKEEPAKEDVAPDAPQDGDEAPAEPLEGEGKAAGDEGETTEEMPAPADSPLETEKAPGEEMPAGEEKAAEETPAEETPAEEPPAKADEPEVKAEEAPEALPEPVEPPEPPLEEPPPAQEPPSPRRGSPRPPPEPEAPEARPGSTADIFQELGLSKQARGEEAKELVRMAKDLMKNGELIKAEGRLDEARRLDPENPEAARLLARVRFELGDQRGVIAETARWITDEVRVQRDQARTVVLRLLNEGKQFQEAEEYDKAIDRYERAIEMIRSFHFNLDLDVELKEAQASLKVCQEKKRVKDEDERLRFERMLEQQAMAEERRSTRYLENQLRELRRKARAAEVEEDYDRAVVLYERILLVNPRDEDARSRLDSVKERRHTSRMNAALREAADNFELAILSIEESSIIYQEIFRYPEFREWQRISPNLPSIEEEIAATESNVEKEIKRKLDQPHTVSFNGEPLGDALKQLQAISGINFVLNKEGADATTKEVKLEKFDDLPLKNVLTLLLQSAGEDFTYAIKEGAVVVGPKASLKQKEYLRFYEISDIIQEHPDFKAPKLALDELKGKGTGAGAPIDLDVEGADARGTGKLPVDKLVDLVKKEIGGAEGEAGGVSYLGGKLSARTSLENHLKLSRLLDQFRRAVGMMVTVESRFLDIQDNFLEEIGINLGSGNANFLPNNIPDIDGAGTSVSPGYEWVNPAGDTNLRLASIGNLSQPLGTKVNPFNFSSSGGGAYQLNVLKADRYQLEAILTGVAKEQEIRKLNSPRVTAFNGQVAHTLVVNQAAYIQDLEVNQTGVIPVINPVIDVLNSGSILEVRPTISYDRKYIVLEIQPTLAERLASERAILNLSSNFTVVPIELPVLSVTKIKTTVTVPDGGTVLVGGLKREISNKAAVGIPGLLDMPFMNLLFGRKGVSNLRSNLFVLINAKITIVHEEEARLFGT